MSTNVGLWIFVQLILGGQGVFNSLIFGLQRNNLTLWQGLLTGKGTAWTGPSQMELGSSAASGGGGGGGGAQSGTGPSNATARTHANKSGARSKHSSLPSGHSHDSRAAMLNAHTKGDSARSDSALPPGTSMHSERSTRTDNSLAADTPPFAASVAPASPVIAPALAEEAEDVDAGGVEVGLSPSDSSSADAEVEAAPEPQAPLSGGSAERPPSPSHNQQQRAAVEMSTIDMHVDDDDQ